MDCGPMLPISIVCPSGRARTTSIVPMTPPAPDLFSAIAFWPQRRCRWSATNLPMMSVVPPGAAGTMMLTVWPGRQPFWARLMPICAMQNALPAPTSTRREVPVTLAFSFSMQRGSPLSRKPRQQA